MDSLERSRLYLSNERSIAVVRCLAALLHRSLSPPPPSSGPLCSGRGYLCQISSARLDLGLVRTAFLTRIRRCLPRLAAMRCRRVMVRSLEDYFSQPPSAASPTIPSISLHPPHRFASSYLRWVRLDKSFRSVGAPAGLVRSLARYIDPLLHPQLKLTKLRRVISPPFPHHFGRLFLRFEALVHIFPTHVQSSGSMANSSYLVDFSGLGSLCRFALVASPPPSSSLSKLDVSSTWCRELRRPRMTLNSSSSSDVKCFVRS